MNIELKCDLGCITTTLFQHMEAGFEAEDIGNLIESFLTSIGFGYIKCIHEDALKKLQDTADDKCPF